MVKFIWINLVRIFVALGLSPQSFKGAEAGAHFWFLGSFSRLSRASVNVL